MHKKNEETTSGRCEHCGKFVFHSRKAAKRYTKRFPGEDISVYACYYNEDYYHFGHTPKGVRQGDKRRGDVEPNHKWYIKKSNTDGVGS